MRRAVCHGALTQVYVILILDSLVPRCHILKVAADSGTRKGRPWEGRCCEHQRVQCCFWDQDDP